MQEYIHCFYLCIKSSIHFIYSFRILLTFKLFITPFFDYIYHSKCLYPFICLYLHQSYFTYFTSMSIADWLLGHNITVTGTMRADRKGIPPEMKMIPGREPKPTKWCYNEKKMVISWADKKIKQKDPKLVLLVSTMHDQRKVSKNQRTKPQAIVYYDSMKGGVDVVDFISAAASTRIESERWTINALSYTLDTVHTNSKNLDNKVNKAKGTSFKQLSTFEFTWELGQGLALPWTHERHEASEGLQMNIRAKMCQVLKLPEVVPAPLQGEMCSMKAFYAHHRHFVPTAKCVLKISNDIF